MGAFAGMPKRRFLLRLKAGWRGLLRLELAAAPIAVVLYLAQQQFMERSSATSTEAPEATMEDYLNFK